MREDDDMLERGPDPHLTVPSLQTPAMARAIELARELLRERGLSEDEIERELDRPPGSGVADF